MVERSKGGRLLPPYAACNIAAIIGLSNFPSFSTSEFTMLPASTINQCIITDVKFRAAPDEQLSSNMQQ